jgi:predicted Zn finger-like uncharacterized protein
VFRVVPDQLKVSQGWVRCGRCSELFDARVTLSPQVPVVSDVVVGADAAAPGQTALADSLPVTEHMGAAPDTTPPVPEMPGAQVSETSEARALVAPLLASGQPDEQPAPAPEPRQAHEPPERQEPTFVDGLGAAPQAAASLANDLAPPLSPPDVPQVEDGREQQDGTEQSRALLNQVSFMRRARRQAFLRKPIVRAGLGFLALALGLALVGQVAYRQRDELAQRVPAIAPLLSALCQPLQCKVGPPQRIGSIFITASSFSPLQPDAFRLQFTLANEATLPVALPAVELTLTDSQDQTVIRRVLQPTELGPDVPPALPAGGEWSTAVTLIVAPTAAGTVTGFRLLAFYP